MTLKNIIPELVSIDTDKKSLFGFSFSENFDFYGFSRENKLHFKVVVGDVTIPKKYAFKNGFYSKEGNSWYYDRKIFNIISLKFKFTPSERGFIVNKWYLKVPFCLGRILPFGKHVEDIISLELFLDGYIIFQGSAISYNDKNICIIGPSYNGKTFALKGIVEKQKGRIISDDLVLVDFKNNLVYPMPYKYKSLGVRKIQKKLSRIIAGAGNELINEPVEISRLFFVKNYTAECKDKIKENVFFEFIVLCSLFFLDNRFIMSYIVEEKLLEKFVERIEDLKKMKINNCHFINIRDFDYNFLTLSKQ